LIYYIGVTDKQVLKEQSNRAHLINKAKKRKKKEIEVTKQVAEYCRSSGTARKIGLILLRCRSTIVDEADPVDR